MNERKQRKIVSGGRRPVQKDKETTFYYGPYVVDRYTRACH